MATLVKAPWHLWVVGILTLLWNSIGAISYTMTRLGMLEALEMPADQIAYMYSFPIWANTLWAMGVWGAIAGSLLILLRSRFAVPAMWVAMIGLVGTTYYQRVSSDLPTGMDGLVLPILIWVTTLFMLWYVYRQRSAGVLR